MLSSSQKREVIILQMAKKTATSKNVSGNFRLRGTFLLELQRQTGYLAVKTVSRRAPRLA